MSAARFATQGYVRQCGWELAWAQTIGLTHARISEDAVGHAFTHPASPTGAVYVAVADGVGSGARPEVAAHTVVAHGLNLPEPALGDAAAIAQWVHSADRVVAQAVAAVHHRPGAAMLVAAWLQADGTGHLTHVGDARAYRFDPQACALKPLTHDQTYDHLGEVPPAGSLGADPARMVGSGCIGTPPIQPLTLASHEFLLLCTDGLHRGADDATLTTILGAATQHEGLDSTARDLCMAALRGGSTDDITVLLARRLPAT